MKKICFIVTIFLIFNYSNVSAYNWKYIYSSDDGSKYFLDLDSLSVDVNNDYEIMYHSMYKKIYSDEGRKLTCETFLRNNGWLPSKCNQISYSIFLEYFKMERNQNLWYAVDSETVFAFDGSIIDEMSYSRSYHKWNRMVRGQIAYYLGGATLDYMLRNER